MWTGQFDREILFLLQEQSLQTLSNVHALFYDTCGKTSLAYSGSPKVVVSPLWRRGEKKPNNQPGNQFLGIIYSTAVLCQLLQLDFRHLEAL